MERESPMWRAAILLILLSAGRAPAEPMPPGAAMAGDPVLSARCGADIRAFGCANAANLSAMARPRDLVAGRPLAPADGALEAAAVGRLMNDKVRDLRREGTGVGAGSGGPQ